MKNINEMQSIKVILVLLVLSYTTNVAYAIDPDREYIRTPDDLGLNYETLVVRTCDGYDINTWIYSADAEKDNGRLLILAYPDAGNMSYFVYHSAIFASQGYTVVTFDYRGFGKSADFEINKDSLYYNEFATDLIAVTEEVHQKFQDKQIGIWAMSMGTIIAVKAMGSLEGKVDFMVTEGFVSQTSLIVERTFEQKGKTLSLPEESSNYLSDLKNINIPTMIFAASHDKITTYEDALNVKKIISANCEVIRFDGEHLGGFNSGDGEWGEYYIGEINLFLKEAFG
ncbi:alpha/beta hydrolase [Aquiflexum sp.]|uniref:alpha/beta hydrolase n=1 Tax=Aquiflexum sp. TaxID=1872584 RepID=UPI003594212D